jgi:hypothetical protein
MDPLSQARRRRRSIASFRAINVFEYVFLKIYTGNIQQLQNVKACRFVKFLGR